MLASLAALMLISGFLTSAQLRAQSERDQQQSARAAEVQKLFVFQPYAPGYLPAGMDIRDTELKEGRRNILHVESHLRANSGRRAKTVEMTTAEYRAAYSSALAPPERCDVKEVEYAMVSTGERNFDDYTYPPNAGGCLAPVVTPGGRSLQRSYISNSQWTSWYLRFENTIIVFTFDEVNGMGYTDDFLPELIKIVDSLQPIAKADVPVGIIE